MHILSGKFQRRLLKFPKDRLFRPTKGIVRESVFNIIGGCIEDASFLDLCSGSGALGFEAESRGAAHVVCVDRHIKYLLDNKAQLGAQAEIIRLDIVRYLKMTSDAFDIIYLDPVWSDQEVYIRGIELIFQREVLKPNGLLMVEHQSSFDISCTFSQWYSSSYQYGQSMLSLFKHTQ